MSGGDSHNTEGMDSSGQGIIPIHHHDVFHSAVEIVFRTENIVEKICSYLESNDLKQFRLVSRLCNNEGRRALIKRDGHWVVVKSKDDGWQFALDKVLTKLEKKTASEDRNSHQNLVGWIFKRLELNFWEYYLGHSYFLRQWGRYLRKIHLKTNVHEDEESPNFNISHFMNTIHLLLTECCPNLEEMVVDAANLKQKDELLSSVFIDQVESLDFPSLLLKLNCLRIQRLWMSLISIEESELLKRFFTKLVRAAGTALETFEIDFDSDSDEMEGSMLEFLALNVGVSHFQSLQEITLESAVNVAKLSHTVQKCFPKLTKLILKILYSAPIEGIQPEAFPSLKSLKINYMCHNDIVSGRILYFLQHFPNLKELKISTNDDEPDEWPVVPDPIVPLLRSLRSFTINTYGYDLRALRCAVNKFPNLTALNLLGFGRGDGYEIDEPEYGFDELIDTISPLSRLQHLYVNHAFHTTPQLVDAIQLTSNFTALQAVILSQAAHDVIRQDFNVSLYLTSSDPEFQYILDCNYVKRLKLVQLLGFRFGPTQEEVEEEAVAKGGYVSFGTICPCYLMPWICRTQSGRKLICHVQA